MTARAPSPSAIAVLVAVAASLSLAGCYREKRAFLPPAPPSSTPDDKRATSNVAGGASAVQGGVVAVASKAPLYEENAFAVNQGKRLFRWYNCNGCHAQGGGNMGPALMDDKWLYGSSPPAIFQTIMQGRPNGMPSFGGRIPEDQAWQLVAYVRSMSGQLRKDVAPSRSDGLAGAAPENERDQERPVPAPPASGAGS